MTQDDFDFLSFVSKYGKSYGTVEEFNFRAEVFKQTAQKIRAINAEQNTHTAGHNKFSDWTHDEYKKLLGLKNMPLPNLESVPVHVANGTPANDIDWRSSGHVSGVKDQGQCGSCWAFSTTGAIESARSIAGRGLGSFSEEQLVECSSAYGNQACNGGWYYYAWDYMRSYPLENESSYPYTSSAGGWGSCKYNSSLAVAGSTGYVQVAGNTSAIKSALNGKPCSVAIQADTATFQTYTSGVITSAACGTNIDHAVLAVGYGADYYIVKNSWGTWWGD